MKNGARSAPRVSYLVKWVERAIRLQLDAALAPHGLSAPEYTALSVLSRRAGLSSAQLARRTLASAQAMNQIVIRLEKRGLIARKADPEHAKIQRASLSAAGRRRVDACDRATASVEARLLAGLSPSEVVELRRALRSCAMALQSDFDGERRAAGQGASHELW